MSDPFRGRPFPVGALIGAAALLGFSLLAVTAVRLSGIGKIDSTPPPALESVDIRFEDRVDGALVVYIDDEDQLVEVLPPGNQGFIRGVLRALGRERRSRGVEGPAPYRLSRRVDGSVTLEDLSTGRLINLRSFGPTNEESFARLLPSSGG